MQVLGSNFQSGDTLTFVDPQGRVFESVTSKLVFKNSGEIDYQFNDGSDAGTWTVRVNSPDGSLHSSYKSFTVTVAAQTPSISNVSPSSYTADDINHTMQVLGSNFQSGDTLTFLDPQGRVYDSVSSKLVFKNSGEIDYQFNDGSDAGTWMVRVNSPDGSLHSSYKSFTVTVAAQTPSISNVSPSSYTADDVNHTMQVLGSNFQSGDTLTFLDPQGRVYDSVSSKLVFKNSGEIDYQFNDGSDAGTWMVRVNSPDGSLHSSYKSFTVTVAAQTPSISNVSPSTYTADDVNHTMQVLGSNFQSGDTLTFVDPQGRVFESVTSKLVFKNSGEIDYQFNDGSDAGTWTVRVNSPDGSLHSSYKSFTVTVGALPDDYRDDASDTSTPLGSLSESHPTETGIIGPADGNDLHGDKDVFQLTLTQGQTYFITMTGATVNGVGQLPQSIFTIRNGTSFSSILATSSEGSTAQMEFYAQVGDTYYLRAGAGGPSYETDQGGYRLEVHSAGGSGTQIDPGNSTASALDISSAIQSTNSYAMSGWVGGGDPGDMFKISAPGDGAISVDLTGLSADVDLRIINSSGGTIAQSTLNGTASEHVSIAVAAGETVYINVFPYTSAQSNYSLHVGFDRVAVPPPNTLPNASDLIGDHLLRTLAEFARGAYSTGSTLPDTPSAARQHLTDEGWLFYNSTNVKDTPLAGLFDSNGFFTNLNAAAVVARSADSVVVSFRGTDGWADVLEWGFMNGYYLAFTPLLSGLKQLIDTQSWIKHVFITGHSLGATMVDLYMNDNPDFARNDGSKVEFDAITFAHPDLIGIPVDILDFDPRMVSFHNRDDIINLVDLPTGRIPRLENVIEYAGDTGFAHDMQLYVYGTDFLARSGVGDHALGSVDT